MGKYYVAVDCEGVACGVGSPGGSLNASRNLDFVRLQATREADAAARALFDSGAERVDPCTVRRRHQSITDRF